MFGGHEQTIGISFQNTRLQKKLGNTIIYRRELFKLSDGGTIALDWANYNESDVKRPILALLPGLSGDNLQSYIISTVTEAEKHNY